MSDVIAIARAYLGTRERPGKATEPLITKWFRDTGHPEIKDDETSWCAAFVGGVLAEAGLRGSGSLAARSYMQWGKTTNKPRPGDIAVFKRGSGWQGHVAFFLREVGGRVEVLGGNQGNAVSIATFPKSSLLGYRTADTIKTSNVVKGSMLSLFGGGGTAADGGTDLVYAMSEADGHFSAGSFFQLMIGLMIVGGALWALYARWDAGGRPVPDFSPEWLKEILA